MRPGYTLRDIYWFYDCQWYWKRVKSDTQSHTLRSSLLTKMYAGHTLVYSDKSYARDASALTSFVSVTVHIPPLKQLSKEPPNGHSLPSLSPGSDCLLRVHLSSSALNKYWLKWYFQVSLDQQYQHHLQNLLELQILRPYPRSNQTQGVQTNNLCYQSPQEDSQWTLSLRAPRLHISRCLRMMVLASCSSTKSRRENRVPFYYYKGIQTSLYGQ